MVENNIFLWYPFLTVIATLPLFCWEDWKHRMLDDGHMAMLMLVNIPFIIAAYGLWGFGWEEVVVSILPVIIYYLLTRFANDYFHGDDFIYMSIVSICCVVNPLHPETGGFGVSVMINTAGIAIFVLALNFLYRVYLRYRDMSDEIEPAKGIVTLHDMWTLANRFDRGFPMMLVFAPAIILTLLI